MKEKFIELESILSKKWMINIANIIVVEERSFFTESEKSRIPILRDIKSCCLLILKDSNETFWVKNTYSYIRDKLLYNNDGEI